MSEAQQQLNQQNKIGVMVGQKPQTLGGGLRKLLRKVR
jgi:hypothetical protein